MTRVLLPLGQPGAWPAPLVSLLDSLHELFLNGEIAPRKVSPGKYDRAIVAVADSLTPYSITGWHCTRLTDDEIEQILESDMELPEGTMLRRRVDAIVTSGQLPRDVGERLAAANQADESNRSGRLWFIFFPPRRAGEGGIGRFSVIGVAKPFITRTRMIRSLRQRAAAPTRQRKTSFATVSSMEQRVSPFLAD
ncbi:hypothetical protein P0D72_40120 [Paraburkholderia sediminicola]|uniref:hypothetical protein n=1 Tax=Paraburkholderia sediminicola TaxID=458836 RepID=UPI0038BB1803